METRRNLWWQNEVLLPRAQPVVAKRGLAALRGGLATAGFTLHSRDEYLCAHCSRRKREIECRRDGAPRFSLLAPRCCSSRRSDFASHRSLQRHRHLCSHINHNGRARLRKRHHSCQLLLLLLAGRHRHRRHRSRCRRHRTLPCSRRKIAAAFYFAILPKRAAPQSKPSCGATSRLLVAANSIMHRMARGWRSGQTSGMCSIVRFKVRVFVARTRLNSPHDHSCHIKPAPRCMPLF